MSVSGSLKTLKLNE